MEGAREETPLGGFNRRQLTGFALLAAVVLFGMLIGVGAIRAGETAIALLFILCLATIWWGRGSFALYLYDLTKASEREINADYVTIQRSLPTWVFISACLAAVIYHYTVNAALALGSALIYLAFSWSTRRGRIAKAAGLAAKDDAR